MYSTRLALASLLLLTACDDGRTPPDPDPDPTPTTLLDGADVQVATVYASGTYTSPFGVSGREWIPMDLSMSPSGELWVVQRLARHPDYDDETECTSRSQSGSPHDCGGLEGSTVALTDPTGTEPATDANGRARLVVDANSWHFMRRPAGIAFGDDMIELGAAEAGAMDPVTGEPLVEGTVMFPNTFATCHEHWTGNFTDGAPFIGPTLWTADPAIYNGVNGSFEWSNGSHLDMVHSTEYCMGIAWGGDNVYYLFNGMSGAIDRYDFAAPHFQGHSFHEDASVDRYSFASPLSRVVDVPSNLAMSGSVLYIADTGNGRVVAFDTATPGTAAELFYTHESIEAQRYDAPSTVFATTETLAAEWGAEVQPSGLAFLDENLVVANHATGHITILGPDGAVIRTIDTMLGRGLGGLTVADGVVYFTHLTTRTTYRLDVVVPPAIEG